MSKKVLSCFIGSRRLSKHSYEVGGGWGLGSIPRAPKISKNQTHKNTIEHAQPHAHAYDRAMSRRLRTHAHAHASTRAQSRALTYARTHPITLLGEDMAQTKWRTIYFCSSKGFALRASSRVGQTIGGGGGVKRRAK